MRESLFGNPRNSKGLVFSNFLLERFSDLFAKGKLADAATEEASYHSVDRFPWQSNEIEKYEQVLG